MSDAHVRVTVVSDYICPWCYVGMARVERLQREFEIDVEWRPFELHPEIPPEGIARGERPPSPQRVAMYEQLRGLAQEAGLPFERPGRVPNSHRALEAAEFAREHGAFDAYHHALFDAFFGQGRDIGDIDVLAEIAASNGLDPRALREALETQRYAALVDERTAEARASGVTGTPTVIFEEGERRFPVAGAQDYAVFEHIAQRFGAVRRSANEGMVPTARPGSRF
ncbi:MAG: DsbA family oxidoreductase [Dehalococcoidia bacterium]